MKENEVDYEKYLKHYDEEGFWSKVKQFAGKAGAKVIYTALKLFYAAKSKTTPAWAKGVIFGALGYFVLPVDLIPDMLPGVGFSDDLGVMLAAIGTVSVFITDDVRASAKAKLADWFGADVIAKLED